jgi:hypothetical protein
MKSYFIDTAATVTFFTVVAALSELLIAGMDPKQVLIARLIMIPVMMATARPYGLWRDWFFSKTRPQRRITNVVCDIIAFITFQVPVYVVTLALAGATASEIAAAVSASIVFMILLSRPRSILPNDLAPTNMNGPDQPFDPSTSAAVQLSHSCHSCMPQHFCRLKRQCAGLIRHSLRGRTLMSNGPLANGHGGLFCVDVLH